MAEIEKEGVEFPACATLWQGNYIRWQHLSLFMYVVHLYKEVWGILHMLGCQTIALPSTEQIVGICGICVAFEGHTCCWHINAYSILNKVAVHCFV